MKHHIVVGANYGDEGKGLAVNYLAHKLNDNIIVRFNGGAQAAHTVELHDGTRHIHHSLGSGTLAGSPTLLSEFFIVNPNAFNQELIQFPRELTTVYVHREAMLTTPFD